MDFFQGSSPPNFIPFCLDEQHSQNDSTPNPETNTNPTSNKVSSPPTFPPLRASTSQTLAKVLNSPHSTDSNVDVTAHATEMAPRMELAQTSTEPETQEVVKEEPEMDCPWNETATQSSCGQIRTSTPVPLDQSTLETMSLT